MIISNEGLENGQKYTQKVLEQINNLSYSESVVVLEMARETIRTQWMAETAKEMADAGY